jgi:lantibiotic transport system ATP-binding protein
MSNLCLSTQGLHYAFSKNSPVLQDLNLQVPEGSIYGFLGANGAGKTTTLRLILGLLKNQQGAITVFGKPLQQNRVAILRQTGSLIESPSLYSHLNARENLVLLQKIHRCKPSRIDEALQMVGLSATAGKKVSQFSLGMKQRLGLAAALLHQPSLLILDEPTNGLDPNGIIEMRALLKMINRQYGVTILISSHLLAEIEKLVTHIGIIHRGKLLFQGTLDALQRRQVQAAAWQIETNDDVTALRIIRDLQLEAGCHNGKLQLTQMSRDQIAMINAQLVTHNLAVYSIAPSSNDLETIFMDLITN